MATAVSLVIHAADPASLARFYSDIVGVEPIGGGAYFELATPSGILGIADRSFAGYEPGAAGGPVEVTVEVADADEAHDRLTVASPDWVLPITWFPWGRTMKLRDPEGNVVAVNERFPGATSWPIRDSATTSLVDPVSWHLRESWWWIRRVLDGLTEDEFHWAPVERCWSVEETSTGWRMQGGPAPDPPPFTTIAWRLNHVILEFEVRTAQCFGGPTRDEATPTAVDAVRRLHAAVRRLRHHLLASTDDDLRRKVHATWTWDVWAVLTHMLIEVTHHSAEIGVVRDLHRQLRT
jgi:predicted enzyme related to lactoylglutathione lyase